MTDTKENKFLNVRIGVDFYDKLSSHKAFNKNYKAISPAFYFLKRVAALNAKNPRAKQSWQEVCII